jgi:subtilisin family serine protease
VTIRAVAVNSSGCDFTTDKLIAGIEYVANNKSPNGNVINFSIEVDVHDTLAPAFEQAIANAVNSGIVFVTAAGNEAGTLGIEYGNSCSYDPGRLPYVINVGASDKNDLVAWFSNYGSCITLFAPGDHVEVADNGISTAMDVKYPLGLSLSRVNTISGTSFSSPIVAGIAALYLQNNPGANPMCQCELRHLPSEI